MNWFQRHLNWSLSLVDILLPFVVNFTFGVIFVVVLGGLFSMGGAGVESTDFLTTLFTTFLPIFLVFMVVSLGIMIFIIVTTLWYLGRKGRSKGLIFLIVGPWAFTFVLAFFGASEIGEILGGLGYIVGVVILLLLENQAIGYGGDFGDSLVREPATDQWADTRQYGTPDDWRPKDLDYSPQKNIESLAFGESAKDVGDAGVPSGEFPAEPPVAVPPKTSADAPPEVTPDVPIEAPLETPLETPATDVQEKVAAETSDVPTGASEQVVEEPSDETLEEAPAEAVEEVPVEPPAASAEAPEKVTAEVPAETIEEPIAESPAEAPEEAPAEAVEEVPVEPPAASAEAPEEVIAEVPAMEAVEELLAESPAEALKEAPEEISAEPAAAAPVAETARSQPVSQMPILLDDTGAVIKCFYHPEADAVNRCSRCGQYVCSQCNYVTGTHPICRNCWDRRAEVPMSVVSAEKKEGPKLGKPDKGKVGKEEGSREFVQLYEQALPVINTVITRGPDGLTASPLDLMEGLKLRPILEYAKKLPKLEGKELQEAKKEFEQLCTDCIKIAEKAADFFSAGGQTIPTETDFARLVDSIEKASALMGELYPKMASLSQPRE